MAVALIRPAYRSVRENTGLAGLSVVLAFALWIFVTDAENPTRTRVLPVDLPVEPVHVDPGVVVANDLGTVRVRISVEEDVFASLTAADFEATVDLEGITVGTYQRPVAVRRLTTRGGLRIEEVLPDKVEVVLVPRESKEVPVVINVTGEPAPGYSMAAPEPEQAEVTVSGRAEAIALATQAVASIDVEGRTESVNQAVRLEARDDNGNLVDPRITIDPPFINVSIRIEQTAFSRSVTVNPQITGVPAEGYNVVSVSSNPINVTVKGEPSAISGITTISTEEISVEDETESLVKSVRLRLPPGISVVGSPNVTVTVRIEPAQGSVRLIVPLTARGLASGLSVKETLPNIKVTLTGAMPDLLHLSPADISATVDLTGKDAGVHKLRVEVGLPNGLDAEASADPGEVELTLEKS